MLKSSVQNVNINYKNINIEPFKGPGIYALKNKTTKQYYIGQSEHLIIRIFEHLMLLSNKKHWIKSLISDWYLYGQNNFEFIILEMGTHLSDLNNRKNYEAKYIYDYLQKKEKIYNNLSTPIVFNDDLKKIKLEPINWNITNFYLPGLYYIKNNITQCTYIGQSKSVLARLARHINSLRFQIHENANLKKDWKQYGSENFVFIILEVGQHLSSEKNRRIIENQYIEKFKPNVYNVSLSEFQMGRAAWNRVSVYKKEESHYKRYENVSCLVEPKKISEIKIREYLNDPKNTDWYYGRSFARYIYSKRTRLVVLDFQKIYLNKALAASQNNYSYKSIAKAIDNLKNRSCLYLDQMTIAEKKRIPNLAQQVKKVLRLTIPLPLNASIPMEKEILLEQSPTYPETTDEIQLSNYSSDDMQKMYDKLNELVKNALKTKA